MMEEQTWSQFCLVCRTDWVQDRKCCWATKPMCHNYYAYALEPGGHNCWAYVLQLLMSVPWSPRPATREATTLESLHATTIVWPPLSTTREQPVLLLLLSCFSRVRLCATPEMAAHQAPLSLGFSRQEHWSGVPFPSPMYESEKWKWSRSVVSDS